MSLFNRDKTDKAADKPGEKAGEMRATPPQASPPAPSKIEPQAAAKAAAPSEPLKSPSPIQLASKGVPMASVISKALKITGELESTEDIQIDGQIDGDVRALGVKIGQNARVKGTVYGDEVELAGTVEGRIESKKVSLSSTARMTGDVWFQDIKIESGAYISGNLKPDLGQTAAKTENRPEARPAAKPAQGPASVAPLAAGAPARV